MMVDGERRESLLRALITAIEGSGDPGEADTRFVQAFLRLGSETEENLQCVRRLGVTELRPLPGTGRQALGMGLRDSGAGVADVLNAAEGSPVPAGVMEEFPQVSQEDWDAVMRLATMVFVALER